MEVQEKLTQDKTAPRRKSSQPAHDSLRTQVWNSQHPRETRMEEMLQVAGRIFAERGYHGTSMDDIAAEADISKPLLYRYFGSKDGLYIALIERAGQHLLTGMRHMSRPKASRLIASSAASMRSLRSSIATGIPGACCSTRA